jgi:hypothetical protein
MRGRVGLTALACAALLTMLVIPADAQTRWPATALPAPVVMRIPNAAARQSLRVTDPNAPRVRGEFATSIRTRSDRAALRARIERDRALENARFAKNAGPGTSVRLRRPRW